MPPTRWPWPPSWTGGSGSTRSTTILATLDAGHHLQARIAGRVAGAGRQAARDAALGRWPRAWRPDRHHQGDCMLTVVAFIVALGLLIAVHEYGHYRVAVACGVRVLRFSVGFGKTLYRWQPQNQKRQNTEFVIGAFSAGRLREDAGRARGAGGAAERHLAFNTQPLRRRAAIVAAGPAGQPAAGGGAVCAGQLVWRPGAPCRAGQPGTGIDCRAAGLRRGRARRACRFDGESRRSGGVVRELRWLLTRGALDGRDVRWCWRTGAGP
jgi:hypothetical protein